MGLSNDTPGDSGEEERSGAPDFVILTMDSYGAALPRAETYLGLPSEGDAGYPAASIPTYTQGRSLRPMPGERTEDRTVYTQLACRIAAWQANRAGGPTRP